MKVVINNCFGGFGISTKALKELVIRQAKCIKSMSTEEYYGKAPYKGYEEERKTFEDIGDGFFAQSSSFFITKDDGKLYLLQDRDEKELRTDKDLIEVVEQMKQEANGSCASLKIVEIPDGIEWFIHEYDGTESIEEAHRSWY